MESLMGSTYSMVRYIPSDANSPITVRCHSRPIRRFLAFELSVNILK